MSRAHLRFSLPERLTLAETRQVLAVLEQHAARHPDTDIELDLAALRVFDSSALALLLAWRRQRASRGQVLLVSEWPRRLTQLATLYGVHSLLTA